jgi:hypothetical protein
MRASLLRDEDQVAREVVSTAFTSVTDSIIDTHSAVKILAVTVTAEIVAFAMIYVSKDKVQQSLADHDSGLLTYGSIACFVIGFLIVFAAYRLIERKLLRSVPKITVWLVSTVAGIANLALFFMLVNFQLR